MIIVNNSMDVTIIEVTEATEAAEVMITMDRMDSMVEEAATVDALAKSAIQSPCHVQALASLLAKVAAYFTCFYQHSN